MWCPIRLISHHFFTVQVTDDIAPGYSTTITRPMYVKLMREKASGGKYRSLEEMNADAVLMFQNCVKFNDPSFPPLVEVSASLATCSINIKHLSSCMSALHLFLFFLLVLLLLLMVLSPLCSWRSG